MASKKISVNPYLTPLAIVIGAVLISLAILYTNGSLRIGIKTASPPTTATPSEKLVGLAESINLDKNKFKSCLDGDKRAEVEKDIADAEAIGSTGTPTFYIGKSTSGTIDGYRITGAYPFDRFQAVIDALLNNTAVPKNSEDPEDDGKPVKVSVDDDPMLGDAKAPITIIEFSDYECPFCKRHFTQTYSQIKKDYIDTGKVKLIYRDFIAVDGHNPWAMQESLAANCAKDLAGDAAYFKYHDLIYQSTKSNGQGI